MTAPDPSRPVHLDAGQVDAWLKASCDSQGVPVVVRDPGIVQQVTTLLGRTTVKGRRSRSQSPLGVDTADVEPATTSRSGSDGHVVDNGPDDGLAPVKTQRVPFAA